VAVGGQVFLHNARLPNAPDANPKSDWSDPRQETLIPPSIDKHSFEQIATFDSASALLHFCLCNGMRAFLTAIFWEDAIPPPGSALPRRAALQRTGDTCLLPDWQ